MPTRHSLGSEDEDHDEGEPMPDDNGAPQRWINQQVAQSLAELRNSLDGAWRDLRAEIRRGDARQNTLNNLDERMRDIRSRVDTLEKVVREDVMTREDFKPYRNGLVAVISAVGLAVLGALLKLVIPTK